MISKLDFLLGQWNGEGHAAYPTIEAAYYLEELTFEPLDNTTITFLQKTWRKKDNSVLHWESGYFIAQDNGTFTFLNAQNSSRTEVMICALESPGKLICDLKEIGNDARPVKTRREFSLEGNALNYRLFMQTQNQPFQLHLTAKLERKLP